MPIDDRGEGVSSQHEAWWAAWTPSAITICRRTVPDPRQAYVVARSMPADWRYTLRLFATERLGILLRSADETGTRVEQLDARGVPHPISGYPDALRALPPYQVLPQSDGTVIGLDDDQVLTWRPGQTVRTLSVPQDFVVRDATTDHDGTLWIAGSLPASRSRWLTTRGALAASRDDGRTWQLGRQIGGGMTDLWRAVASGALAEFRWIRVAGDHLVVAALGGPPEDSSTLVAVRDPRQRWHTATWGHDTFRGAATQGGLPRVISHRGRRLTITSGHRLLRDDLSTTMARGFGDSWCKGCRIEVLDAEPAGPLGLMVAAVYQVGESGQTRICDGVFRLDLLDLRGADPLARHGNTEPEIITAVSSIRTDIPA